MSTDKGFKQIMEAVDGVAGPRFQHSQNEFEVLVYKAQKDLATTMDNLLNEAGMLQENIEDSPIDFKMSLVSTVMVEFAGTLSGCLAAGGASQRDLDRVINELVAKIVLSYAEISKN